MLSRDSENVNFIVELAELVQKHYPDGSMSVGDITTYFGMILSASLANQPRKAREEYAKKLSREIVEPDPVLVKAIAGMLRRTN